MRISSHARGASSVQYLVAVGMVLVFVAGGAALYRSSMLAGAACLASRVVGIGGASSCGGAQGKASAQVKGAEMTDASQPKCDSLGRCTGGVAKPAAAAAARPTTDKKWELADAGTVNRMIKELQEAERMLAAQRQAPVGPSISSPGYNAEAARWDRMAKAAEGIAERRRLIDARIYEILSSSQSTSSARLSLIHGILDSGYQPGFSQPQSGFMGAGTASMLDPNALTRAQTDMFRGRVGDAARLQIASFVARYGARAGFDDKDRLAAAALLVEAQSTLREDRVHELHARRFQWFIEDGVKKKDATISRFADLLQARELLKNPELAPHIDRKMLDTLYRNMSEDADLTRQLAKLHADTSADLQMTPEYQRQVQMIEGQAFLVRLRLEGPEQAQRTLQTEIGKVALVNPQEARRLLELVAGKVLMADFFALSDEEQAAALAKSIDAHLLQAAERDHTLKDSVKYGVKAPADVMKRLAGAFKAMQAEASAANRTAAALDMIDHVVEEATSAGEISAQQASLLRRAFKAVEHSDAHGAVSSIAGGAAIIALGYDLTDPEFWRSSDRMMQGGSTALKVVGSAESYGKLGAWVLQKDFAKTVAPTALGHTLKFLKHASWIGDVVTAYVDHRAARKAFENGDALGGLLDSGASASAAVSAIGGIAYAAGMSGPLAPWVLVGGTVAYLGFKGIKWATTEPDDVKLLKKLGVYKRLVPPRQMLAPRFPTGPKL